jgi:hypothetical protein
MKPNQGEQDLSFFSVWGDGVDFGLISHFSEGNDMLVSVVSARLDVRLLLRPIFVRASSGRSPHSSPDANFGQGGGRVSSGGSPRSSSAADFGRGGDRASSGGSPGSSPAADFGRGSDRVSSGGSPCSSPPSRSSPPPSPLTKGIEHCCPSLAPWFQLPNRCACATLACSPALAAQVARAS